ncbi:MAG: hypothetical protein ACTSR2_08810, partial [Candidatus Hodarchaeales archaeon]
MFTKAQEGRFKPFIRVIAFIVIFCFLYQDLASAYGPSLDTTVNMTLQPSMAPIQRLLDLSFMFVVQNVYAQGNSSFNSFNNSFNDKTKDPPPKTTSTSYFSHRPASQSSGTSRSQVSQQHTLVRQSITQTKTSYGAQSSTRLNVRPVSPGIVNLSGPRGSTGAVGARGVSGQSTPARKIIHFDPYEGDMDNYQNWMAGKEELRNYSKTQAMPTPGANQRVVLPEQNYFHGTFGLPKTMNFGDNSELDSNGANLTTAPGGSKVTLPSTSKMDLNGSLVDLSPGPLSVGGLGRFNARDTIFRNGGLNIGRNISGTFRGNQFHRVGLTDWGSKILYRDNVFKGGSIRAFGNAFRNSHGNVFSATSILARGNSFSNSFNNRFLNGTQIKAWDDSFSGIHNNIFRNTTIKAFDRSFANIHDNTF